MARTVPPQLINRSEMPAENPHYKHLNQLPVLTHTPNDAGAYITQGFIYARTTSMATVRYPPTGCAA